MVRLAQPNNDAVRFGAIVRRIRVERRLMVRELAARAGVTPEYLGVLERGRNVPTLTTLLNIAAALGADPAEMVREVAAGRG